MEILRFEFKKFFINNKGIIIVPITIIAIFILNIFTSNVDNPGLEVNKERYYEITSSYNLLGKVTDETKNELNSLIEQCDDTNKKFDRLLYDLQVGKITTSEYQQSSNELSKIINNEPVLNLLQAQFEYSEGNVENRYIMYTNAWNLMFEHSSDIYFLIFALMIVTIVFTGDVDNNGVRKIIITCKNGRSKLLLSKFAVAGIILTISYLVYLCLYIVFIHLKFGLDCYNFPIQSLQLFANYNIPISLVQGYIFTIIIRLISLLSFSSIIFTLYSLTNSSMGSISFSIILILLPTIISNENLKYLPQKMCNYNLCDFNIHLALGINLIVITLFLALSIIFWKRKSNAR